MWAGDADATINVDFWQEAELAPLSLSYDTLSKLGKKPTKKVRSSSSSCSFSGILTVKSIMI